MLGAVLVAIGYSITNLPLTAPIVSTGLTYSGWVITVIATSAFIATILPYIIDQMVGSSAAELSAAIFWWYWSTNLGSNTVDFILNVYQSQIFWIITGSVSVTIPVVTHLLLKQWLVRVPILVNPIKHIAQVLNYARKNKYPRRRSALTYWENDYPSRVDLGKDKYGGPFTEEEVEDVKTFFRLLPLLIPMTITGIFQPTQWYHHYSRTSVDVINRAVYNSWSLFLVLALISIWQLLMYPLLYNWLPSMLKRIGAGLFLLILAPCSYTILELIGHSMDKSDGCYLNSSNTTNILPISVSWLIIPQILHHISKFILIVTSLEFIVAQAPTQIRALMIGLSYAVSGLIASVFYYLQYAFNQISFFPSCGFYYFLTVTVILVVVFILLVFLSRRYRLRERNIPVNYHLFAENYYDKYKYVSIARELERQGLGERDHTLQ